MKVWMPAIRARTGADVFTQRLANALRRAGIDCTVTWYPRTMELLALSLRSTAAPPGTDLVHGNAGFAWVPFAARRPVVLTMHGYTDIEAFDAFKPMATRAYHRHFVRPRLQHAIAATDGLTAVSDMVVAKHRSILGTASPQVICNWIDPEILRLSRQGNVRADRNAALFLGRNHWAKGGDLLPALAAALRARGLVLRCSLSASDWPSGANRDGVEFLGHLDPAGVVREIRRAGALVMPSRCEGFPLAALEAMACRTPVVGFAGTGLESAIVDGKSGLLVPMGEIAALADAVGLAIEQRDRLGDAALARLMDHFTEAGALQSYLALYERTLATAQDTRGDHAGDARRG